MRYLRTFMLLALALVAFAPVGASAQSSDVTQAAQAAADWIRAQQQPDGSFPGFSPGDSADAVQALVAAGVAPADLSQNGTSVVDFLQAQADYAKSSVGAAAKLALAAVALGEDPRQFAGQDLLQLIGASYDPATGQYGADVYGHALALLATRAAQATPPPAALARVLELQLEDGGWSFDGTSASGSDTNTTALVVQALAGETSANSALQQALAFLQTQQNDDGGFPYQQGAQTGSDSDANSTAAVLLALAALGEDESALAKNSNTPLSALITFQNESGALRYQQAQADDNALATYQALPALFGKSLPVVTRAVAGAQAALVPADNTAQAPDAAVPANPAPALPATGAPIAQPVAALAALAVVLLVAGLLIRQRARRA